MATSANLSPADQVRAWMAEGAKIKTEYIGEQGGLFSGSDRMIRVKCGRASVDVTETEFASIADIYNATQPAGTILRGLQTPMMFDSGFWVQGNPGDE